MQKTVSVLVVLVAALSGCVEKKKGLTEAERQELGRYVSTTAPTPGHTLDVDFDGKVQLIGYDVSPPQWRPGQRVTVTWYWKAARELGGAYRLFTHLGDAGGASRVNHDGVGVVRERYQPEHWRAGEFIRDEQSFTVPSDWTSPQAVLFVGVWHSGNGERLRVTRGPNDGEDRARAVAVPVEGAVRQAAVPDLTARRVSGPIVLDGELTEPDWAGATRTGAFVNTMNGERAEPEATARALWDDAQLYVAFEVKDPLLRSTFAAPDDHLWEQDCVEIMLDPDGDGRNYFEMQVSPSGVVFDTRYDAARDPRPFGHVDWSSTLRAGVRARGTVNDDGADEGYTVEVAIPWTGLSVGTPPPAPPRLGDTWRMNLFVMDAGEDGVRAVGWSPPRVGDFHTLARFGRVRFVDAAGGMPPAEAQAAGAPPRAGLLKLPPDALEQLKRASTRGTRPAPLDLNRPRPGEEMPTRENPRPYLKQGSAAPAE